MYVYCIVCVSAKIEFHISAFELSRTLPLFTSECNRNCYLYLLFLSKGESTFFYRATDTVDTSWLELNHKHSFNCSYHLYSVYRIKNLSNKCVDYSISVSQMQWKHCFMGAVHLTQQLNMKQTLSFRPFIPDCHFLSQLSSSDLSQCH